MPENADMIETGDFVAFMIAHEGMFRLCLFVLVFGLMFSWENRAPKRELTVPRWQRWRHNLALTALNTLLLRLLFPAAAVGLALSTNAAGFGLFNRLALPLWLELPLAVLVLDLAIYWQHRLMHRVPLLWRLHRVHHADLDIDLTTGARFHPLEILLSMLYKWAVILLLGPATLAVLVFELLLNGMAMFNHANVALPARLDRALRRLLVTPDMHRVHHSIRRAESDSNFGFNLSLWDRWFGSYTDQPAHGHRGMTIGLAGLRDAHQVDRLPGMLKLPFVGGRE
ncbi:MAG: sterol desaturase family protein [Gammaproteobacteria bacterium]|nr:sterol desaturase family protein [Gammaproteobacteria bacterium]